MKSSLRGSSRQSGFRQRAKGSLPPLPCKICGTSSASTRRFCSSWPAEKENFRPGPNNPLSFLPWMPLPSEMSGTRSNRIEVTSSGEGTVGDPRRLHRLRLAWRECSPWSAVLWAVAGSGSEGRSFKARTGRHSCAAAAQQDRIPPTEPRFVSRRETPLLRTQDLTSVERTYPPSRIRRRS